MAERKRETGYRLEILFDAQAKPRLQLLADALGLDVAAYARTLVLRGVALDLEALRPVLGPGERYRASGPRTGPGTGPSPGTPLALSGDDDDEEESSSSSSRESGPPVPADDLEEALAWKQRELEFAGHVIGVPDRWRAKVRADLARKPKEVEALLERKDRAEELARKPKIRPAGRDPT